MILTDAERTVQVQARETRINAGSTVANPVLEFRDATETVLATVTLHDTDAMDVVTGVGSLILDGGASWVDHEITATGTGTLDHGTILNKDQEDCGEVEASEITIASTSIETGMILRFSAAITVTQPSGA